MPSPPSKLAAEFVEYLKVKNYAPSSITTYHERLQHFLRYLQARQCRDMRQVDRGIILDFSKHINAQRPKRLSAFSIASVFKAVKLFFRYLEETDQILHSPATFLKPPRFPKRLPKDLLTNKEMTGLLNVYDLNKRVEFRDRTILEVFLATGIRLREMCALEIGSADLEGQALFVREGKFRRDRLIPLNSSACFFLRKYLKSVRPRLARPLQTKTPVQPTHALWICRRGKPLSPISLRFNLRQYAKRAGIRKKVSPHLLRHWLGTALVRNLVPLPTVSKILGHRLLSTTNIYCHLAGVDLKAMLKRHPRERATEAPQAAVPILKRKKGYRHAG